MNSFFEKVTPESQGLSSKLISKLLDFIKEKKYDVHGLMIVRNNKVLFEGYQEPFHKDFKNRIYSCSKSVVSLAIGKLIGEGKLKLTDKLITFFPEYIGKTDEEIASCTIEDALTMTVSIPNTTYCDFNEFDVTYLKSNWPGSSFEVNSDIPNGMLFRYNTSASYLLDVIVEKITGKTFLEYLKPEFDKMGISEDISCVKCPDGYSWGGSGVLATLTDFAKISNLILNKGKFNGEELIPYDYMQKATSKQISNITVNACNMDTCGYGYQIWIDPYGFALRGLYGQDAHCYPDKNFLFVFTAGLFGSLGAIARHQLSEIANEMYKSLVDSEIVGCEEDYKILQEKSKEFKMQLGFGDAHNKIEDSINGKKIILNDNKNGFKWIKFDFNKDSGLFSYENSRGVCEIPFGYEEYKKCKFPEKYSGKTIGKLDLNYDTISSLSWVDDKTLFLQIKIVDIYLGVLFFTVSFKGDKVVVNLTKNTEFFMCEYSGLFTGKIEK